MNLEHQEVVGLIQQILPDRHLSDLERVVLYQAWLGKRYDQIADELGYDTGYLRVIGSRLWRELSEAVGQPISKHNIRSFLREQQEQRILSNPQIKTPPQPKQNSRTQAKFPGSLVSHHSPFYIERPPIESCCYAEILQPGALIRIKAPKKMGKSSLLRAILDYAAQQGYYTLRLNLQQADNDAFSTIHYFLRWFCKNIAWKLNLDINLDEYWDTEPGLVKSNCMLFLERFILSSSKPFVLGLDEVDRLLNYPQIAQDFLPFLRVWHEEANENESWENMRLVLVHATDVYPTLNIYQSPFNVGLPISLPEFTLKQVQCLAQRYGFEWDNQAEDLMAIVGGHPYLIQLALYQLAAKKTSFTKLLKYAPTESGIYANHLRHQLDTLQGKPELLTAMKSVVESEEPVVIKSEIAYQLKSMGLVKITGNKIMPSCQLYRQYFQ